MRIIREAGAARAAGRVRPSKKGESGARSARALGKQRAPQHRAMLAHFEQAAGDSRYREDAVAIVTYLSTYFSFTPLEWDNLASGEKLKFYQLAGNKVGCNVAVSFNFADKHRRNWVSNHGDITEGVREVLIRALRDAFRNKPGSMPPLWYVVEPQRSKGREAKDYVDGETPRRFGFHGAVRLASLEQLELFESVLLRFAYNTHAVELRPIGGYMAGPIARVLLERWFLKEGAKPEHRRKRIDPNDPQYTPAGWFAYATKNLKRTTRDHADVCGVKPFGATSDLHAGAVDQYNSIRAEVLAGARPWPADVKANLDAAIQAIIRTVPATQFAKRAQAIDKAVAYALLSHRTLPAPDSRSGAP